MFTDEIKQTALSQDALKISLYCGGYRVKNFNSIRC